MKLVLKAVTYLDLLLPVEILEFSRFTTFLVVLTLSQVAFLYGEETNFEAFYGDFTLLFIFLGFPGEAMISFGTVSELWIYYGSKIELS